MIKVAFLGGCPGNIRHEVSGNNLIIVRNLGGIFGAEVGGGGGGEGFM